MPFDPTQNQDLATKLGRYGSALNNLPDPGADPANQVVDLTRPQKSVLPTYKQVPQPQPDLKTTSPSDQGIGMKIISSFPPPSAPTFDVRGGLAQPQPPQKSAEQRAAEDRYRNLLATPPDPGKYKMSGKERLVNVLADFASGLAGHGPVASLRGPGHQYYQDLDQHNDALQRAAQTVKSYGDDFNTQRDSYRDARDAYQDAVQGRLTNWNALLQQRQIDEQARRNRTAEALSLQKEKDQTATQQQRERDTQNYRQKRLDAQPKFTAKDFANLQKYAHERGLKNFDDLTWDQFNEALHHPRKEFDVVPPHKNPVPQSNNQQPKTISPAKIKELADQHGKTYEQAHNDFLNSGYVIA